MNIIVKIQGNSLYQLSEIYFHLNFSKDWSTVVNILRLNYLSFPKSKEWAPLTYSTQKNKI